MCLDLDISLHLVYTPTNLMEADAPSRFRADIDFRLSEGTWAMVDRRYGPHDVDLMATPVNVRIHRHGHQLRFFSPVPCPGSGDVNVFAQSFSATENYYMFPPFVLIGCLQNVAYTIRPTIWLTFGSLLAYLWLTTGPLVAHCWPTRLVSATLMTYGPATMRLS